jgi:hypothetical protein
VNYNVLQSYDGCCGPLGAVSLTNTSPFLSISISTANIPGDLKFLTTDKAIASTFHKILVSFLLAKLEIVEPWIKHHFTGGYNAVHPYH